MKKSKIIIFCIALVVVLLLSFTFLEFIVLKILGFQYASVSSLVLFFVLYFLLLAPLDFIVNAIPKAFKSVGILETSKGLFSFCLYFVTIFMVIFLLDLFMDSIHISWQGIAIFSIISALVNAKLRQNDDEPPSVESAKFDEISGKFKS